MPRRSAKPPYEIMSGSSAPSATPRLRGTGPSLGQRLSLGSWTAGLRDRAESAVERVRDALAARRDRGSTPSEPLEKPWWIASSAPVTLRIPKGLFVGVVAAVVALIGLAFWVGLNQGRDTTLVQTVTDIAETEDSPIYAFGSLADIPGGADGTVIPFTSQAPDAAEDAEPTGLDARVPGLNYLVFITTVEPEAERLRDFLAEHGVRAIVVPVGGKSGTVAGDGGSGHTTRLFRVVDVSQGFTREQYRRGEHREFHNARLQLGQAWKRHNGNRGDDLSSMTFYKYVPAS